MPNSYKKLLNYNDMEIKEKFYVSYAIRGCNCGPVSNWIKGDDRRPNLEVDNLCPKPLEWEKSDDRIVKNLNIQNLRLKNRKERGKKCK